MENINDDYLKNLKVTKETWITHKEKITLNGITARIVLRARPTSKTLLLRTNTGTKFNLGNWDEELFTFDQAVLKALKLISGETTEQEFDDAPLFIDMIHQVLDFNEKVLERKNTKAQRARIKQIPKSVLNTPITMLRHTHAREVRSYMLENYTVGSYNYLISELSAYWRSGRREFYRELLQDIANPFEDYKIRNVPKKKIIKPKFDDVIDMWKKINEFEIDTYWKLFWKLKICLGCHNTELINMTSDNLIHDEHGDWFYWGVGHHKISNNQNNIEHRVWIHPRLKGMITAYLKDYEIEKYWFFSRSLNYGENKHEKSNKEVATTRWKRLRKKSGINFAPNLFRHALITYLNVRGKRSEVVTGHCYTGSTQKEHYMNWEDPDVLKEFKDVGKFYQEALINELGDEFEGDVKSDILKIVSDNS